MPQTKARSIIIFLEPSDFKWLCPSKIANLYMNRFAIDEEAAFEIQLLELPLGKLADRHIKETEKEMIRKAFNKASDICNGDILPSINLFYATQDFARIPFYRHKIMKERKEFIQEMLIEFELVSALLTNLVWIRAGICDKKTGTIPGKFSIGCSFNLDIEFDNNSQNNLSTDDPTEIFNTGLTSLHDELDLFFHAIHKNEDIVDTPVSISPENFFRLGSVAFQKLTKHDSKLTNNIDEDYLENYHFIYNKFGQMIYIHSAIDVTSSLHRKLDWIGFNLKENMQRDMEKLQLSESKLRFLVVIGCRETLLLRNANISWIKDHQRLQFSKNVAVKNPIKKRNSKQNKTQRT